MDNPLVQYWLRIFSAVMLIKMATDMVRQAEKLVTANVKARYPEVAETLNGSKADILADTPPKAGFNNGTYVGPTVPARHLEVGMTINDNNTPRVILNVSRSEHNVEVELPGDLKYSYNPSDQIAVVTTDG